VSIRFEMTLKKSFLTYLKNTLGIPDNAGILLAISGGVDSMCMLNLFENTSYRIVVAHVNFQLRGEDSNGDELMIKNRCKEQGIVFQSKKFETVEYAKMHKISTQMAARDIRFTYFNQLMEELSLDFIATAHHAEDSLETALLNLIRGTGLSGLKGILPRQNNLIHPLLFVQKEEILAFAVENKLKWREDSSNVSIKYKRNFIRHKVVPLLKEQNPQIASNFLQTSKRITDSLDFIERQAKLFMEENILKGNEDWRIKKSVFFNPDYKVLVEYWLETFGFNYSSMDSILHSEDSLSGTHFLSSSHLLNIDRDFIIVSILKEKEKFYELITEDIKFLEGDFGRLTFERIKEYPPKHDLTKENYAFMDLTKLKFPLILRNWELGDRIIPFGMKGSKKVSDFLIDCKMPLPEKEKVLVLCSDNEIIWILNHRVSANAAIDEKSSRMLKVSILLS
jgi:tRNA(Ile)-lysidine synthase